MTDEATPFHDRDLHDREFHERELHDRVTRLGEIAPIVDFLVESEQRYAAVIENASDMIQSVRPDGTFEFVNGAWRRALGWSDAELDEMIIWDLIPPAETPHCQREFGRAMEGHPIPFIETKFIAKDGREVPVEGSVTLRMVGDEVVATHGFFRDVTERLRAEELEERAARLEREERARYLEKMAALGKLAAGLAHELNNPAAAIQRAAGRLEETTARRDAAQRALVAEGVSAEGFLAIDALLQRSASFGEEAGTDPVARQELETRIESWLEGAGVTEAWRLAPVLADGGVTDRDLTALAEAVPSSSMSSAMGWITESLSGHEATRIVSHGTHRISDLVAAIKSYSHMDRATEHISDVHDGIEDTLVILGHRLRDVRIERDFDRELPPIPMFGNSLNQVWTNLLDNALDAIDDHGHIAIRTARDGDRLVVEIEDDGPGIPPDVLPRIFEPFYTSKPQGVGTGLGLDTVWRIVTEEHGGSVEATSAPGRTLFHVSLPLPAAPAGHEPVRR
ncbi:two-component system sensor histidine kinase NtrB [Knoellia sinensis]|nr:ATP-binding protein [Knoellia sinensis]